MKDFFAKYSHKVARAVGSPWSFFVAFLIIIIWAVSGPVFHFSDTWQLVINTGTTIVTFLMVFIIQNTQNRDSQAMELKLNELIKATKHASNQLIDLEEFSSEDIEKLQKKYRKIAKQKAKIL